MSTTYSGSIQKIRPLDVGIKRLRSIDLLKTRIDRHKMTANIIVTGATASLRGAAHTAPFAPAKAAQRSLAQSIAKHAGPDGVHVSYVILDGAVDLPETRTRMPDAADDAFLKPDDIADTYYFLTQQHKSAWTFEIDVRPFVEKWSAPPSPPHDRTSRRVRVELPVVPPHSS